MLHDEEVSSMSEEEKAVLVSRMLPGCRLRLVFLPGWGEVLYLPYKVVDAMEQIIEMKFRGEIDMLNYDLVTLNAIRTHGYYGSAENNVVEITLKESFNPFRFRCLLGSLEEMQILE